jgi:hypothetical protein
MAHEFVETTGVSSKHTLRHTFAMLQARECRAALTAKANRLHDRDKQGETFADGNAEPMLQRKPR